MNRYVVGSLFAAATLLGACSQGAEVEEVDAPNEITLGADGKADVSVGGLTLQDFDGPLHFGSSATAKVQKAGSLGFANRYKIGYTLRAKKNTSMTITVTGQNGAYTDTILWVYRQNASGSFTWVSTNDALYSTEKVKFKAPADGIYLAIVSAKKKTTIQTSLGCNEQDKSSCELGCIVPLFYSPVCGVDGNNYGNGPSAACFAVPVAHPGRCTVGLGAACDQGDCADGLYCANGAADGVCAYTGTCVQKPSVCNKIYKPVCGCDGKTYGNACAAAGNGVNVASEGACACTGPVDYAPSTSEVVGEWWSFSGSYPTRYSFGSDGSYQLAEYVSPCPTGVTCVWSGIKYSSGKYQLSGTVIGLFAAGNTSGSYDDKLNVKQDCDGALFAERNLDGTILDYKRGASCESRPSDKCDYAGECKVVAQGCENPCQPDGEGGVICHPCDPILTCVAK